MKAGAKARFSKVVDIAEDREFWRKGKAFVELQVCGPIMNLLRKADSDNSGTGKVYHENFKFCKILQSMTDSPEFDFIPRVCTRYFHQYPIKMDGSMDKSLQSVTWCRILPPSRDSRI